MISLVKELPEDSTGKTRIISRLEDLLIDARAGKITGFCYILEMEGSFAWGKVNMTYPAVLGALDRAAHHVNREWDAYIPQAFKD